MCEGCGCDTPKERPDRQAKKAGHWHVHADGTVHQHADDTAHHHHHAAGPMDRSHRDEDIAPHQRGPQEKP